VNPILSVVVPAFNEETEIVRQLSDLRRVVQSLPIATEIILVDDGSTDKTAERAEECGIAVLRLERNLGYGAALKKGIAAAAGEWILIIDADGTYPPGEIPALFDRIGEADMVVGARTGAEVRIPLIRRPAKWLLRMYAICLAGQPIPDLNSGMRIMRKTAVEKFRDLLPDRFSFTSTITVAMLSYGHKVVYVPINYYDRVGTSKIRPADFPRFLLLLTRTMLAVKPMRVLFPLGAVPIIFGIAILQGATRAADTTLWGLVSLCSGLLLWGFGLIAARHARRNRWDRA
jgi:glycosyltransferase involved in cell wall biosynthesis